MDRVTSDLNYANKHGICPVCRKRSRAIWYDTGQLRVTCGADECFEKWVPGRRHHKDVSHEVAEMTVVESENEA